MKNYLLLALASIALSSYAQDSIPNGDFEMWNSVMYESPLNYPYNSNETAVYDLSTINVIKTTDTYHGQSAVQLSTLTASFGTNMGYFLNTPPENGDISLWTGGIPYTEKPTGIRGYYKYNVATEDSAMVILVFRKGSNTIGTYQYKIGGIKTTYTLFDLPLVPALTESPDSVVLGFVSSDYMKNESGVPGSVLKLDSVSFTGVTNQPAAMNGDFELWQQSQTPYALDGWGDSNRSSQGIDRTSDAKTGQYALELYTYLGDEDEIPRAQSGYASTGYWDNKCNCQKGGKPFTNSVDTLTFWYKYAPSANDSAMVSLEFRKEGVAFAYERIILKASTNYKYVEIPFQLWQNPDSIIINLQSTVWENQATSFVGSVLKVDDLRFKWKAKTGLENPVNDFHIRISTNHSKSKFIIHTDGFEINRFDVFNSIGAKVYPTTTMSNEINLSNYPNGIYYVRIQIGNKMYTQKILKL